MVQYKLKNHNLIEFKGFDLYCSLISYNLVLQFVSLLDLYLRIEIIPDFLKIVLKLFN